MLEDDPNFNAGRGSVLTSDGRIEMDAALMDGASRAAGAVAGVSTLRNPIEAARAMMEAGDHVLMAGAGADAFARARGVASAEPGYFLTRARLTQLEAGRAARRAILDHDGLNDSMEIHHGTVGAVALDADGDLAAGTSTGGLTNKRPGRVGDSPIVGAGTYADNATAAVSCTGTGEAFLRAMTAHDIAARMRYGRVPLAEAAEAVIREGVSWRGRRGGVIALDGAGDAAMPFNTEGLYRGIGRAEGRPKTAIHAER